MEKKAAESALEAECANQRIAYLCAQLLSGVQLFVTPWTVTRQVPLSMGLSWQEYWSGLPFLPPDCVCGWGGYVAGGVCVAISSSRLCVYVGGCVCVCPERSVGQARSRRLVWGP